MKLFPSAFFCLVLLAGCATSTTPAHGEGPYILPAALKPSPKADLIYAYLKMEQAMRGGNVETLVAAAHELAAKGPASRPLADAAGWLLGNRQLDEARKLLDVSVKALPGDLVLHIMLAETMLESGENEAAIALLRNFLNLHPDDPSVRTELALLYLKSQQPDEAMAILDAIPKDELTPTILYYQAQALRNLNDLEGTARKLKAALDEAPDFLEAMLELALVEEQRDHYPQARELYEKLLTYDEGNQDIMLRLMLIAFKEGNPDRAFTIAEGMQDSFGFSLTASTLFMNEGRYDLAESLLNELAEQEDTPGEIAFYQAAVAYEGHRDVDRTLALLAGVDKESRFYDRALKLRIQVLYENGRAEEALNVARQAAADYPDDMEFRMAEAELYISLKQYDQATAIMGEAVKEFPDDSNLAFRHAFMVDMRGDKQEALRLMEGILERFPDEAQVLNYIGYTLADENRDLHRALTLLTKAVELSPDADYIIDSLAWAHYRLGNYEEAWIWIQKAVSLSDNSTDPTMWDHYGDIAHALGDMPEARKGWEKSLTLEPEDPAAVRAKLENIS